MLATASQGGCGAAVLFVVLDSWDLRPVSICRGSQRQKQNLASRGSLTPECSSNERHRYACRRPSKTLIVPPLAWSNEPSETVKALRMMLPPWIAAANIGSSCLWSHVSGDYWVWELRRVSPLQDRDRMLVMFAMMGHGRMPDGDVSCLGGGRSSDAVARSQRDMLTKPRLVY